MTKKPFVIYKSSAGSGKTYTLAKNYIRLSLKSKNYFTKDTENAIMLYNSTSCPHQRSKIYEKET